MTRTMKQRISFVNNLFFINRHDLMNQFTIGGKNDWYDSFMMSGSSLFLFTTHIFCIYGFRFCLFARYGFLVIQRGILASTQLLHILHCERRGILAFTSCSFPLREFGCRCYLHQQTSSSGNETLETHSGFGDIFTLFWAFWFITFIPLERFFFLA
jgi:hypothetical protein